MNAQHVTRHPVDIGQVNRARGVSQELFETLTERLVDKPTVGGLFKVSTLAENLAACAAVLDPSHAEVPRLIRTAARAQATIWALAHSDGQPVEIPITKAEPQRWEGKVDQSHLSSASWLDAYFLATLAGDLLSLATVCYAPTEVWRTSSTRTEEYIHLFAEALRLYALRDDAAGPKLLAALRATDKSQRHLLSEDWVLDIDVPMIEVTARLFSLDAAAFDTSLAKAFRLFRDYWGAPNRAKDIAGWFARALAALVLLAGRNGLSVMTTSDYAPPLMLDALEAAADRSLVLCPYCMVPIPNGASICHACREDPRNDAAFEMTAQEYMSGPRKRCTSCHTSILDLAVRCPSCRAKQ